MVPSNASNRIASWESSDPSIAEVDALGNVTGLEEGSCTITAVANATGQTLTAQVTVQNKKPESITVTPETLSIKEGSYVFVEAAILPEDANNQDIVFESEDPSIATVDGYGEVHGVKAGTTRIWAVADEDSTVRALWTYGGRAWCHGRHLRVSFRR